jgi:hypothetical protein
VIGGPAPVRTDFDGDEDDFGGINTNNINDNFFALPFQVTADDFSAADVTTGGAMNAIPWMNPPNPNPHPHPNPNPNNNNNNNDNDNNNNNNNNNNNPGPGPGHGPANPNLHPGPDVGQSSGNPGGNHGNR